MKSILTVPYNLSKATVANQFLLIKSPTRNFTRFKIRSRFSTKLISTPSLSGSSIWTVAKTATLSPARMDPINKTKSSCGCVYLSLLKISLSRWTCSTLTPVLPKVWRVNIKTSISQMKKTGARAIDFSRAARSKRLKKWSSTTQSPSWAVSATPARQTCFYKRCSNESNQV